MTRPRRTLRSPADLARAGLVAEGDAAALDAVAQRYAVAVTPAMAALIDAADPSDPIGAQFLPHAAELDAHPGELADPIGDEAHSPVEGVVHRYPDRVLLKLLHVCPVYCRFCFRREAVGPGGASHLSPAAVKRALDYVCAHPEIFEVIFTGGDPLVMAPGKLAAVTAELGGIAHVQAVRFHSRVPAVDPDRITPALIAAMKASGKATHVVLHANHPRELTPEARAAIARIVDAGMPMLSQSVLLAGVNDDAATLEALFRAFVANRVKPYYLHQLDRAPGTARFHVPIARGQALMRALRGRLSGLALPEYVLDIPGGHGKAPIGPGFLRETGAGRYEVEDFRGRKHAYEDEARRPLLPSGEGAPRSGADEGWNTGGGE